MTPSGTVSYCCSLDDSSRPLTWPGSVDGATARGSSSSPPPAPMRRGGAVARGARHRRRKRWANDVLHGHCSILPEAYLKNRLPDGWTDPWIGGMAVQAALVEGVPRHGGIRGTRVAGCLVALLAEERLLDLQHLLVDGAVGVVTVEAVLTDGSVLPEERPALLGVARVAVLVDRGLQDHLVVGRAVRVVAARALELALAQRHVARPEELGLLLQVAARAQIHLRLLEKRLRHLALGVRIVAVHARDVRLVVAGAHPVLLARLVVALHARRRGGGGAQVLEDANLGLVPASVHVGLAGRRGSPRSPARSRRGACA